MHARSYDINRQKSFAPRPSAIPNTAPKDSFNASESMAWLDTELKSLNHSVDGV